jgi:TonB family protein
MRNARLALTLLAMAATPVWAIQAPAPGSQDGPASVAPPDVAPPPHPFPDGSYPMAPGITAPKITQAVAAVYPADTPGEGIKSTCVLYLVIGADGTPVNIHVVRSAGEPWDAAAIEAVRQSKFEAGSLNQQAIPVRTRIRVNFSADRSPAIPVIFQLKYRNPEDGTLLDSHPIATHSVDPQYSDEARRKKIQGNVIVSVLVGEDGLPTQMRIEKSLGYGLDEKALAAAGQYRFTPATKDGKPVATRISIEMSFRLY